MDFAFEQSGLHNFLWRTSLDRREVSKKLFSISFGGVKGRHGGIIFWQCLKKHDFSLFSKVFEAHMFGKRWQDASSNTDEAEQAWWRCQISSSDSFFCLKGDGVSKTHVWNAKKIYKNPWEQAPEASDASKNSHRAARPQAQPSLRVSPRGDSSWRSTAGSKFVLQLSKWRQRFQNMRCLKKCVVWMPKKTSTTIHPRQATQTVYASYS